MSLPKTVAIIGTGQQGASMAQALSAHGNYRIAGYDADADIRARFSEMVAGDDHVQVYENAADAVAAADIIILATPIDKFGAVLDGIRDNVKDGAIITDVGSGKQKSIEEIKRNLPYGASYVPVHPLVGAAGVGPETGSPEMYKGQPIIVVPGADAPEQEAVEQMWRDMGGRTEHMSAMVHDKLYGTISHFEHVIAFAEVLAGEDLNHVNMPDVDHFKGGNTLLDTTRIAQASIPMWQAIFRDNNASVMAAAQGFEAQMARLKEALKSNDPQALQDYLQAAHDFRSNIEEDRPREGLQGEIYDWALDHGADEEEVANVRPESLASSFNLSARASLAKRTMVPALVSAALTLNAIEIEKELPDVTMADKANPSFKDGSAAMLSHPEYVANLLYYNRDILLEKLERFEQSFALVRDAVRDRDDAAIADIIERASSIRGQMPAHKTPDQMREAFVVDRGAQNPEAANG